MPEISYYPSPTLDQFHRSTAFVRAVMGPIGSGKSVGCAFDVFDHICNQAPGPDGKRRSRWAVIRNTYGELRDTTVRTWLDWFRPVGSWSPSDFTFRVSFNDIEAEVLFRALDRPDDIKKLLSLELTGGWINEAREVPRAVFEALQGRVGRFPSKRDGGPTWFGVILDTNPPDTDHWMYRTFVEAKPDGHALFIQPSGLSPEAENIENLPPEYYTRLVAGKKDNWVDVYCRGKWGHVADGKPVYSTFSTLIHSGEFEIDRSLPIRIGMDFGLTPAAVFGQRTVMGAWRICSELVSDSMGVEKFALEIKRHLADLYPGMSIGSFTGDPAGDSRAQTDERTPFMVLAANKLDAFPASTNDPILRVGAVEKTLGRLIDGQPGLKIHPRCKTLKKGFEGGYAYKRIQVSGEERYADTPLKNNYSHVHDALQYLLVGAGESDSLIASDSSWSKEMPYTPVSIA